MTRLYLPTSILATVLISGAVVGPTERVAVRSRVASEIQIAARPIKSGNERLLIPAYFRPGKHGVVWRAMCARINHSLALARIIMNPSPNGDWVETVPPSGEINEYIAGMNACRNRRQEVIGYVYTEGGTRDFNTEVRPTIDKYYRVFPRISGIFFDQMSNAQTSSEEGNEATKEYYRRLHRYVKHKSASATVVGNAGIAAKTDWQVRAPRAVDILVNFEGPYRKRLAPPHPDGADVTEFRSWMPPEWVSRWPARRFAHLVYRSRRKGTTTRSCRLSAQRGGGSVFVTGDDFKPGVPPDDPAASPWNFPPRPTMLGCPTLFRRSVIGP